MGMTRGPGENRDRKRTAKIVSGSVRRECTYGTLRTSPKQTYRVIAARPLEFVLSPNSKTFLNYNLVGTSRFLFPTIIYIVSGY